MLHKRNIPLFAGLLLISRVNVAIRARPDARRCTYAAEAYYQTGLHTPGGGTRLLAQHVSMVFLRVSVDPYPCALSLKDRHMGGPEHSPVQVTQSDMRVK